MTLAQTNAPRWFAVDSDHDLSGNVVSFSLVAPPHNNWFVGTYGAPDADVQAELELEQPIEPGYTRYWWFIKIGSAQSIQPLCGTNIMHGKVDDTPSGTYYKVWRFYQPYE